MPRANRYFLPDHIWHITHRCHKKEFLLKFAKDRNRWRHWLFEARKRFGLCILNYIVTSNHIHLLVRDRGQGEIAKSMQLVTGCTAQAYNQRKRRNGAFWEDRYHATAVDSDTYLAHCMVYVDLNMVRAGAVTHPSEWPWCGYCEIQSPPQRYGLIDRMALTELFGVSRFQHYQELHRGWVENKLKAAQLEREPAWTQSLAVGHRDYVESVRSALGVRGRYRSIVKGKAGYELKEPGASYAVHSACEMDTLRAKNTVFFEQIIMISVSYIGPTPWDSWDSLGFIFSQMR